jgi:membrane protease YdiL (CAAX protease family)
MTEQYASSPPQSRLWQFFLLTFVITWVFWIPLALAGQDVMAGPMMIALIVGGFGPSIAGIVMVYRTKDEDGRRDFWRRSVSFKLIGARWYAVILLLFPLAYGLGILLDVLFGGSPPGAEALVWVSAQPAYLLVSVIMALVIGPLAEELGWRGFALDELQSNWNALASSLILGGFWWLWHFPEFFMVGIATGEIVSGVLSFLSFTVSVIATSILYTWVYNNNGRSILSAILLHFMHNFILNMLLPISNRADIFKTALLVLMAIGVVVVCGQETFTCEEGG